MSFETQLEGTIRQIVAEQIKQALQMEGEITGRPQDYMRLQSVHSPGPWPWLQRTGSGPNPWEGRSPAVALFVSAVGLKQVATKLPDGQAKRELLSATEQSIADWEDDYCGTKPPHPHSLASLELALELSAFANSLQESNLRTAILQEAGKISQRSFGGATASKTVAAKA